MSLRRIAHVAPLVVVAIILGGCAGGSDSPTDSAAQPTTPAAAHVSADPCSKTATHHSNLRQRCVRGSEVEEVARPVVQPDAKTQSATCERPALVQAYAQDDWIGLAKSLAAAPEGCLEAWISVPTEPGADGAWLTTRPRMKQRFAAIGDNVHPMPEVNFNEWNAWGKKNPSVSWLERGRRARAEMEKAGYDFDNGDHWAFNEVPVAALVDDADRDAVQDLVRGLQGDSPKPTGVLYIVMPRQEQGLTPELGAELRDWFSDESYWREMKRSVVSYSVEAYASIKDTCEARTTADQQMLQLRGYAFHHMTLAERFVPSKKSPARTVVERSVPLTNGAWSWSDAYGFTAVPLPLMQKFIALQVQATIRALSDGTPVVGFAWAPKRPDGIGDAAYRRNLAALAGTFRDAVVNEIRAGDQKSVPPCRYAGAKLVRW